MFQIEIVHQGLNKYKIIRGNDMFEVQRKAAAQTATWDEMWEKKTRNKQKTRDRQQNSAQAVEATALAQKNVKALEDLLIHAIHAENTAYRDFLNLKTQFTKAKPQKPVYLHTPLPPRETDDKYRPQVSHSDYVFVSKLGNRLGNVKKLFQDDYNTWLKEKERISKLNAAHEQDYQNALKSWQQEEREYVRQQREGLFKDGNAVVEYCTHVLSSSKYPDCFPHRFEIDYNPKTKLLIVDYSLPSIESIPRVKEVKYVKSSDEFKESYLTDSFISKLYDSVIYQVVLRLAFELFRADANDALDLIVINGWVQSIDKSTGKDVNACIVSLQTKRQEFLSINLDKVDPKACFKNLKGVGSSKLSSLTPIAPILQFDRNDKRFVASYTVTESLDDSTNLAAIDWEDFEHLIRELFEKEFSQSGGEVKVTRASRDGGVDAVAFDPDPIRGGKIVIQAKRYTNTVGVSAVRDLFGTVMNEGATKGILVTTSDYGPDAYEFAKGKPITLLTGGNLLHLLEKHGYKAKIDLKAAKAAMMDRI